MDRDGMNISRRFSVSLAVWSAWSSGGYSQFGAFAFMVCWLASPALFVLGLFVVEGLLLSEVLAVASLLVMVLSGWIYQRWIIPANPCFDRFK